MTNYKKSLLPLLFVLLSAGVSRAEDALETKFAQPPAMAHPQTWWHWVSGNVSKEGITADLEAMKRIGLNGAQLFTVDQSDVKGPVVFMSPEWRELVKHTLNEAARLKLEISMEGCDGWSESGGPWVAPSQSMQKVVWSETLVQGGKNIPLTLPQPETIRGYYEDISIMAVKASVPDLAPDPVSVTTSPQLEKPVTGMPSAGAPLKFIAEKGEAPFWIQYEFAQPITCASINYQLAINNKLPVFSGKLEVSDDGVTFRAVCELTTWRLINQETVPVVIGKFFRVTFNQKPPNEGWTPESLSKDSLTVLKLQLAGVRVNNATARAGMGVDTHLRFTATPLPAIEARDVVDLTGKTTWDAPEGNWTILRIGHTSTGKTTSPSTSPGLECDKMSAAAVNSHIDHLFNPVWEDSPDKVGNPFKYILLDSWEAGCENWTTLMPEEFRKRRGYDLGPWLPALTGRIIGSVEETERFLWDYRRTMADLLAENHYGVFQKRAHEKGMGLMSEAPGQSGWTVADPLLCKKYCDVPMGEFWVKGSIFGENCLIDDTREAASAAHVYGQNIAASEAFTSTPNVAAWKNDPYSLKALGDLEFCNGVNLFVFHRYAHQPWLDRKPGMSMGPWGINFERTNTWWNQGSAWIDYLSRCQSLLQQGRFCADLCYFYGEGAPVYLRHSELRPAVPKGYDYDVCNADALLNLMETKDGRITTPSGMSYRVLVLPPEDRMTLPVLKKVAKLVHDGAVVYGPKPLRSPSLSGYPGVDQELSKLADEVWGNCDGKSVTEHAYGAGKIVWGTPLEKALGIPQDFSAPKGDLLFIHRKDAQADNQAADIYFVSNQKQEAINADCSFRVAGKIPELWHPDTGKREIVALYNTKDGVTTLPIPFDPVGSVFVIFRTPQSSAPHPVSVVFTEVAKNNAPSPEKLEILKATYGAEGKSVDVTARVGSLIENGNLNIRVDTATLNVPDPALNIVKQLSLEYKLNGKTVTQSIPENGKVQIEIAQPFTPQPSLRTDAHGQTVMTTSLNGDYVITYSDGTTKSISVKGLPAPWTLDGSWNLVFPPFAEGKGVPVKTTFEKLISWSDSTNDAIKFFSGTATYSKTFTLPNGTLAKNRHLTLDLGSVKNIAEVTVNGKPLGILWKEPFQADVTGFVKDGENTLAIQVTNLWPNRLIGDQKLAAKDRLSWASVSLYKSTDPLLPSGLLGPVTLKSAVSIPAK
jgi:hypothetical protein